MTITLEDVASWQSHIGRTERRRQTLDTESLRRFAVAVGLDGDLDRRRPPLGHWAWFLDTVSDDRIGPDGHGKRGGFLPAIILPRRMFAAGRVEFLEPLVLETEAELLMTVADVRHKPGRSGDLMFVEVDREISQEGEVRLRERQTIVYRGQGAPAPLPEPEAKAGEGAQWLPDPVQLFRFSAATFNSHRIHYDLPYARDEEGYPDLVVHGTFIASRLAAFAEDQQGRPLASFEFRAQAPMFAGQPVRLRAGSDAGSVQAIRCDGAVGTIAKVSFQ